MSRRAAGRGLVDGLTDEEAGGVHDESCIMLDDGAVVRTDNTTATVEV